MSVFVLRGCTLQVSNLTISLDPEVPSNLEVRMGYDVFPHWLANAIRATRTAERHAQDLDSMWDGGASPPVIALLEQEVAASMEAFAASAAAIEGFYGSALARSPLSDSSVNKVRGKAREKRIMSFFEQRFEISREVKLNVQRPMADIFQFRHAALHSHGKPEDISFHPRHKVSMPRKVVMFRAENARAATSTALKMIAYLCASTKRRYKDLREFSHVSSQWVKPLVLDWLTDHDEPEDPLNWFTYGPTRGMLNRRGLLPHWRA